MLLMLLGAAGEAPPCREHKDLAGQCFVVRGRMRAYNGSPTFRIWRLGTRRLLGVAGGETPMLPKGVACENGFECDVFGEFEVCPLTKEEPGVMQRVCVASVKKRVVVRHPPATP